MGMQQFGSKYNEEMFPGGVPRWHFKDFMHSFMASFLQITLLNKKNEDVFRNI